MFGTSLGGKVVSKGGGKKVVAVEDTMGQVSKGERGVGGGRHAAKVGRRARVGRRLVEAGVCREPVRGAPRGFAYHGHAVGAKAAPREGRVEKKLVRRGCGRSGRVAGGPGGSRVHWS